MVLSALSAAGKTRPRARDPAALEEVYQLLRSDLEAVLDYGLLKPQEAAEVAANLANLAPANPPLLSLGQHVRTHVAEMTSMQVARTIWALEKLRFAEKGVLSALVVRFLEALPSANAKDCAQFLSACQRLRIKD